MISIVDYDGDHLEAAKGLVRSLGYDVATFLSAKEFLDSDPVLETSCLITHLNMPGLNGIELQSRLIAEGHNVPIIFITGFPDEQNRRPAVQGGAVGFLTKPYSDEHLVGCLTEQFKRAVAQPKAERE